MKNNIDTKVEDEIKELLEIYSSTSNINISKITKDIEASEYYGYQFNCDDNKNYLFRIAKSTPNKKGKFVTIYKRTKEGPIAPFDISDNIDKFIIFYLESSSKGYFEFTPSVLAEKDIVSTNNLGGKRGIRVYAPSEYELNSQAKRTQKWQCLHYTQL